VVLQDGETCVGRLPGLRFFLTLGHRTAAAALSLATTHDDLKAVCRRESGGCGIVSGTHARSTAVWRPVTLLGSVDQRTETGVQRGDRHRKRQ
jgi:hypothetical protein